MHLGVLKSLQLMGAPLGLTLAEKLAASGPGASTTMVPSMTVGLKKVVEPTYTPTDEDIDAYLRDVNSQGDALAAKAFSVPVWVWVVGGLAVVGAGVYLGRK